MVNLKGTLLSCPEACNALDKYLTFRRQHGEIVTHDSPLFRDNFDPIKKQEEGRGHHGHTRTDAKEIVILMTGPSIRQYYNRLLFSIGIRNQKKRRHDFSVHGYRKYFNTRAEQGGMKPINIRILMGHSVGISDSYYRPTENELLEARVKNDPVRIERNKICGETWRAKNPLRVKLSNRKHKEKRWWNEAKNPVGPFDPVKHRKKLLRKVLKEGLEEQEKRKQLDYDSGYG